MKKTINATDRWVNVCCNVQMKAIDDQKIGINDPKLVRESNPKNELHLSFPISVQFGCRQDGNNGHNRQFSPPKVDTVDVTTLYRIYGLFLK